MITTRPRHTITTGTDHIAGMLDEAAERWPAERDERGRCWCASWKRDTKRCVVSETTSALAAERR